MKLLIVEDEPELLKSLEDFASKEGYLYDSSKGFHSAAEHIALYDYDCIVLDINLPDGNGFDLLEALYNEGKTGGVIYYEQSPSRPDLVLKDFIKILHPELMQNYEFTYATKIQ